MAVSPSTDVSVPAPFAWEDGQVGADLGPARVLFTTRRGGVSRAPYASLNLGRWTEDDPAAVEENRRRVLARTGAERLLYGRQVHEATVVRNGGEKIVDADGQATSRATDAPIVLTADCLPVALATDGAVAMVHAGWRGLADGVLEEGVAALRDVAPGDATPIVAAIGPCARGCCYEVGDEVRTALGLEPAGGPALIDLAAIARGRLERAGVATVHDTGLCTMCTDPSLFFSHRRDGPVTGRQGGVAWLSS